MGHNADKNSHETARRGKANQALTLQHDSAILIQLVNESVLEGTPSTLLPPVRSISSAPPPPLTAHPPSPLAVTQTKFKTYVIRTLRQCC